ncbi:glycosyl transferase, group 1 [Legionella lansingensis]|uniref:Glycosyl transferase, group 1 n=1 Tax=Legionella lansingensis TaxID=45067 RepID=A0A0W0VVP1_9GAMM|nr:glycosyltransferase family 4 protein [Legionella lansingensis]KTD24352.1 glycosyl transferase, group 1 [Legionella lansingensis]SNV51702.1 glycosyl transferase, group 1 [Legionella lansingensis]
MSKKIHLTRVARVSTVPLFIFTLLRTQVEAIRDSGASVTIITSPDDAIDSFKPIDNCQFKPVLIEREIRLFSDIFSLINLVKLFRAEKFDIVHSNTPKAGLLCAIAARLAGVPIRVHTFTGQTWVTMRGLKKSLLKFCDKLISTLTTCCYADSPSQRDFLVANKIVKPEKIAVLGSGSLAGVDIGRFNRANFPGRERKQIRETANVREGDLVLLFMGRVTKEKGIFELIDAFVQLLKVKSDVVLLVAGPFEQGIEQEIREYSKRCIDKMNFLGFCSEPEKLIAIADILCLPSYREGFGNVVIEAAAMGVPAVGTRIYGLTDAIIDGETGLLVEPKNVAELTNALHTLVSNDELRIRMGKNAWLRAVNEFDSKKLGALVVHEYEKLLEQMNIR